MTTRGKYVVDPSVQKGPSSYPGGSATSRFSPGPISNQPGSYPTPAPPSAYAPQANLYTPTPQPSVYTPAPLGLQHPGHVSSQPQGSPYGAPQSNVFQRPTPTRHRTRITRLVSHPAGLMKIVSLFYLFIKPLFANRDKLHSGKYN